MRKTLNRSRTRFDPLPAREPSGIGPSMIRKSVKRLSLATSVEGVCGDHAQSKIQSAMTVQHRPIAL
jgi:hypothetical protein